MRRMVTRTVSMCGLALVVAGCSASRSQDDGAGVASSENAVAQLSQTDVGRVHLYAQRTGLAVEAFQAALARGEEAAPALNGLGVAYARLGRFDLAHRFFAEAVASDPANVHFAENLSRLTQSPSFAARRAHPPAGDEPVSRRAHPMTADAVGEMAPMQRLSRGEVRIVTAPRSGSAGGSAPRTLASEGATGNLRRLSRGQVHIASADIPMPAVKGTAARIVATGFRPAVRVHLAAGGTNAQGDLSRSGTPRTMPADFRPQVRFELPRSRTVFFRAPARSNAGGAPRPIAR